MNTTIAKSPHRSPSYTKFATPLVLDPPRHCGLATILLGWGKHLLGTAHDCSVRVPAEGVLPRHALIVVSEHRTVVKALDSRTWVNDGPVSEMALRPGDRLSIGPLTFRVRAANPDELAAIASANERAIDNDFSHDVAEFTEPPTQPTPSIEVVGQTRPVVPATRGPRVAPPVANPTSSEVVGSVVATPIELPKVVEAVAVTKPAPTSHAAPESCSVESPVAETNAPADKATRAADPRPAATIPTAMLDLRLDEIEQKLAELHEPISARSSSTDDVSARTEVLMAEQRQLIVRQDELQQRADELARQSQQLHERVARVAEREAEVERSQARLALEHEQLRATAEVTRKELDDEYARHKDLWQEWDAAYRRTSGELNGQLQSMEQRRISLLAETDRVAGERGELQRLQAEHERDRRVHAAERVQLTTDSAALQSLRAEFDTERQQHLVAVQEREARVAAERRAMSFTQEESDATRQQLERERSEFLATRSTEALRREQELREHVEQREQRDRDHARIRDRQLELEQLRHDVEAEQTAFVSARDAFDSQQAAFVADRAELAQLRERLQQAEASLDRLQQTRAAQTSVPVAAVASDNNAPSVSLDWLIEPYKNIHTPPPIPADWADESSVDRNATEEAIDAQSTDSFTHASRSDRDVPEISPTSRVMAPAAASHRFWEDDTLYDTSVLAHSQQPVPTSFAPNSNLMSDSAAARPQLATVSGDDGTRLATDPADNQPLEDSTVGMWSRSRDAFIQNMSDEVETRGSTATTGVHPSVDDTLAEINRQFGVPLSAQDASPTANAAPLPNWWSASDASAVTTVDDVLRTEDASNEMAASRIENTAELDRKHSAVGHDSTSAVPSDSADPLSSLRAQLAQLFDLPAASAADSSANDEALDEVDDGMELTLAPTVPDNSSELPPEAESNNVPESSSSAPAESETTVSNPSAESVSLASTAEAESQGNGEDSIEDYMARLLSRSRGTEVSTSEVKSFTVSASATSHQAVSSSGQSPAGDVSFDPADRSHLTAEPKHKQDRQAARDDLQSFRKVAHQSARSALARHTTKNLLSAVIAKSMLLGVSALATTAFFGAPLLGFSTQIWKGVACSIATLLSASQVYQSWRQLRRWTITGEPPKKRITTSVASPTPASETATSDTTTDAAPSATPAKSGTGLQ